VAAHIAAAASGGPRYDACLSNTQRSSSSNGLWLCQNCGKLVDSDESGHDVVQLERWKREAEERARQMLAAGAGDVEVPLDLAIRSLDTDDFLLYTNTRIETIGRADELTALRAFLDEDAPFLWWLWTGPAGVGKSRLAVELCRTVAGSWHAGFLREHEQHRLGGVRPLAPTLVIVDYAAQRAGWLSDALFELSRRHQGSKIRVLVLERSDEGSWWDTVQRLQRLGEAADVAATMYGLPHGLGGLSRQAQRQLISAVAETLQATLSKTDIEDIADHAHSIDGYDTPLFTLIATMDWFVDTMADGRDDALRRLVARADAQLAAQIQDPGAAFRARNLRFLATTLGGLSVQDYDALLVTPAPSATSALPGLYDHPSEVASAALFDGFRPDIVGELSVLDQLAAGGLSGHAGAALLELAWRASGPSYVAFVERTAEDHPDHPSLVALLDVDRAPSIPDWATTVAAVIPLLRESAHPVVAWILEQLDAASISAGTALDETVVIARCHVAIMLLLQGDFESAKELCTDVLAVSLPTWPVQSRLLNTRGVAWSELGEGQRAIDDFTAVIDNAAAEDEVRAMSFNNRADIYDGQQDFAAAVDDRTSVLALNDTTYNRRYIAYVRRARALWASGDRPSAYGDLAAILATDDIAVEQKMAARLQRAMWRLEENDATAAGVDLRAVTASTRNFAEIERDARALLASTSEPS
jgi:hypothetical protein